MGGGARATSRLGCAAAILASLVCMLSGSAAEAVRFEAYLPSFLGSKSGVTSPQRTGRSVPAGGDPMALAARQAKGGGGEGGDTVPWSPERSAATCGHAGALWNPFRGAGAHRGKSAPSGAADGDDDGDGPGQGDGGGDGDGEGERRRALLAWGGGRSPRRRLLETMAPGWFPETKVGGVLERPFCSKERGLKKAPGISTGERMLAQCLRAGARCRHPEHEVAAAARALPGMKILAGRPKCMVINKRTCSGATGSMETGKVLLGEEWVKKVKSVAGGKKFEPQAADLRWGQHARCAIVGNGAALKKRPKGDTIDKYSAVWRFNSIAGKDPLTMGRAFTRFAGKKTSYRVFSRSPAFDIMTKALRLRPSPGERWMFWHSHSRFFFPGIVNQRIHRAEGLLMYSPSLINWMMRGYFQLRRDLIRLGLGPFTCPKNVNSGLHAVLLAQLLCKETSTFGISHLSSLVNMGHANNRAHKMTAHHSWGFDTMVLRLLRYAGRLDICDG